MKLNSVVVFLFFFSICCRAQFNLFDSTKERVATISISKLPNQYFFEGGVFFADDAGECHTPMPKGIRLTSEFGIANNNFYVAPKVGYEITPLIFSFRTSIANYTNFKSNDVRLIPQVGLGLIFFNFYYSFNIQLSKQRFDFIPSNNFSLTLNLYPYLLK